jgi:hypothetical protein
MMHLKKAPKYLIHWGFVGHPSILWITLLIAPPDALQTQENQGFAYLARKNGRL